VLTPRTLQAKLKNEFKAAVAVDSSDSDAPKASKVTLPPDATVQQHALEFRVEFIGLGVWVVVDRQRANRASHQGVVSFCVRP